MLTNERTTVANKEDACALPLTVNTKKSKIYSHRLANQFFCLFVLVAFNFICEPSNFT